MHCVCTGCIRRMYNDGLDHHRHYDMCFIRQAFSNQKKKTRKKSIYCTMLSTNSVAYCHLQSNQIQTISFFRIKTLFFCCENISLNVNHFVGISLFQMIGTACNRTHLHVIFLMNTLRCNLNNIKKRFISK